MIIRGLELPRHGTVQKLQATADVPLTNLWTTLLLAVIMYGADSKK